MLLLPQLEDLVGMARVALTLDEQLLGRLDRLERARLARGCAKLDPLEEKSLAEESLVAEADWWPEY